MSITGNALAVGDSRELSENYGVKTGKFFLVSAGIAQLVEHQPSKLRVAGSSPVSRSRIRKFHFFLQTIVPWQSGKGINGPV